MKICDTLPQTWEATLAALQTQSDMMKDYSKFSSFITNEYLRRREKETTNDRKTAFNATKESRSKFQEIVTIVIRNVTRRRIAG